MELSACNFSEEYNFLWIAPEKTATSASAQVLTLYGCEYKGKKVYQPFTSNPFWFSQKIPHIDSNCGYQILINTRNPYDRVYSIFKSKYNSVFLKDKINFKRFLYDGINRSELKQLITQKIELKNNFTVIRFENLYEDLKDINFIGDKLSDLQLKNILDWPIPIRDWEKFYEKDTKQIVYKLLEHQFDMFRYPSGL